ncbi:protein PYRICULARIA ORYZAE RESISTANCE 21-like [Curcuma longa]|uniref:protein PYRICULARIA ORYZAE RESISTANCE 21-like n=1 Tax=Curcuma longa TaxID=136217 RepID=UPI003D9DF646
MMAEKMWKLVMEVDLDCRRCSKKIKRTICKLQEKVKILRISYDQKNGIVIIAGRFDPERVSKKLKDEAGKVIKSIKVEEEKEEPPPPRRSRRRRGVRRRGCRLRLPRMKVPVISGECGDGDRGSGN